MHNYIASGGHGPLVCTQHSYSLLVTSYMPQNTVAIVPFIFFTGVIMSVVSQFSREGYSVLRFSSVRLRQRCSVHQFVQSVVHSVRLVRLFWCVRYSVIGEFIWSVAMAARHPAVSDTTPVSQWLQKKKKKYNYIGCICGCVYIYV